MIAYLLCELTARDLESRLLIASRLVDMGYGAVVGPAWSLLANIETPPKGCFLFATANQFQTTEMDKCVAAGHSVMVCDEEALPFRDAWMLANIDPDALKYPFLAVNYHHRDVILTGHPEANVMVCGSPRIDILRQSTAVAASPPYLLFNSGFALINSVWRGPKEAIGKLIAGGIDPGDMTERIAVERAGMNMFQALINWASPQYRVVIRPHPAERAEAWRALFPNVEVVAGSPPLPWLRGARVLIHANSTTGLEAAILGVPCLNLDPIEGWGRRFVMREANYTVRTASEAIGALNGFLRGGEPNLLRPLKGLFPDNGAGNIARTLADKMGPARRGMTLPWSKVNRTAPQVAKFSVSKEQASSALTAIRPSFKGSLVELDDSTFLFTP